MSTDNTNQSGQERNVLRELITFKNWADDIFLDYVAKLSRNQFTETGATLNKSIKQVLFHIYESYWGEYHLLTDQDWSDEPDFEQIGREELISKIKLINDKILGLIDTHPLEETITYNEQGYDKPIKTNAWNIIFNFVEHSSYHRGQLAFLLKIHGIENVKQTNYNPYIWEKKQ